ncbi:Rha family transcriptional regulator, partial [Bacillus cereus group sp. BC330]|uniref:Rha family transcriptional regulator n=1 Tax=Bacillus cereus group sp. BC330 TaxID=3445306 RepID=UPI003F1F3A02
MKELVFKSEKGNPVTTSLLVAEKFEKEHKNILRDIQNLVAQNSAAKLLFIESQYENRGKTY